MSVTSKSWRELTDGRGARAHRCKTGPTRQAAPPTVPRPPHEQSSHHIGVTLCSAARRASCTAAERFALSRCTGVGCNDPNAECSPGGSPTAPDGVSDGGPRGCLPDEAVLGGLAVQVGDPSLGEGVGGVGVHVGAFQQQAAVGCPSVLVSGMQQVPSPLTSDSSGLVLPSRSGRASPVTV